MLFGLTPPGGPESAVFSRGGIEIGSDVWIGDNVVLMGGIKIGDGAVVGVGAVVTNDVPPFSVVAGVPARQIRWRFSEAVRNELLAIRWWDWPPELVRDHAGTLFGSPDQALRVLRKIREGLPPSSQ
jgi:hypothetical protein